MPSTAKPAVELVRKKHRHIPALDGVRGVAILMVMTFHLVGGGVSKNHIILAIAQLIHGFGWAGVDLFFVLSGFLITGILLDSADDPHFFRNFYARRTLRIFPLYYGVLAVCFIVLPLLVRFDTPNLQWILHNQAWLWLYGTSLLDGWTGTWHFLRDWLWLTHLWSLSVEEHFYLVWPAVVFFCARRQVLGRVCVTVAAVVFLARLILMHAGISPVTLYVFSPLRVDSLVIGGFVALLARRPEGMRSLVRPAWATLAASFFVIVLLTVFFGFANEQAGTAKYFTPLALFFGSVLILFNVSDPKAAGAEGVAARTIAHPFLRFLGRYSYGLYVLETLMQPLWNRVYKTDHLAQYVHSYLLAGFAHVFLCVGSTLAMAMLSFHFYEKPFLRLKRYFEAPSGKPRVVPQQSTDNVAFAAAV